MSHWVLKPIFVLQANYNLIEGNVCGYSSLDFLFLIISDFLFILHNYLTKPYNRLRKSIS